MALKEQQYQILKAKHTWALGTRLGYVTIRHRFGIDRAFRFVMRLKELNGESYTMYRNF